MVAAILIPAAIWKNGLRFGDKKSKGEEHMRNTLKNVQYLLFVLFMFALSGCGASNLAGTSSNEPGSITAKVVFEDGKSTAKSVGLVPAGVVNIRFKVTGPYTDPVAKTRYTTTKASFPAAAGGGTLTVSPGTGLIVTVQALGDNDVLLHEGFARNVAVTSGATTNLGTITLTAPYVKAAEVPCLGCHEDSRAADGNNLVAEYKGSRHYSRTVSPSPGYKGMVYADSVGCAGCHTTEHKDLNPAESGRCADCHNAAGTPPNFPHAQPSGSATPNFGGLTTMCNMCHNPHTTALLTPATGMAGCINCHSVGQNAGTNYVQDNNGVRAITGEFAKWSHHVTGVNLNDAHCIACHLEGTVVNGKTAIDTTKHMANATTRLRNADTDAEFVWNPAAPSHSTMDNFCMSCHDDNGATSPVSVQIQAFINTNKLAAAGKTASPTNPFGDTISNQYDMIQRPAVVDAKGAFATTNNSHHAVLGKKYTKRTRKADAADPRAMIAAESLAFASNSSAALPGKRSTIYDAGKFQSDYTTLADATGETGTRNGGTTLGDDSTLHCGDCHTVGQFRAADAAPGNRYNKVVIGAHGSNNEYLLRNNVGTDQLHQGAETFIAGGNADNGTYGTKPYLVCFNCHAFKTYGTITSNNGETGVNHAGEYNKDNRCNGPSNTVFGNMTGEGRLDSIGTATTVANYGKLYGTGTFYGNMFGIQCANCHNSGVKGNIFGGIHGSKVPTYTDGMGNTSKHFRFMPGLGNSMYVPGTKGGFTGGSTATYKSYSGNRNGTGSGNSLGQTWSLLPSRTIKYTGKGENSRGSYDYVTGGVSNDLNWEQRTQQPVAGETDLVSQAVGCYTIGPNAPNYTYSAAGNKITQGSAPAGQQKNPKIIALKAGGYPADDIRNAATTGLTAGDGREVFDVWGGCDDHNGAQGAGTGMVRKVLRKVTY